MSEEQEEKTGQLQLTIQSDRVEAEPKPVAWFANRSNSAIVSNPQQQQLVCITFTSENGQPHHPQSSEPLFLDFSQGQQSEHSVEGLVKIDDGQDNAATNSCDVIASIDNVSLASLSEDINFETKLKVLEAVLPARIIDSKKADSAVTSYSCKSCDQTFTTLSDWKTHSKTHAKIPKNITCLLCGTKFKNQTLLSRHNKEKHLQSRNFSCIKCNLVFQRETQLKYHERRVHLKERSQTCHFCGKGFFKRCDLKMHLSIHLGIVKNICETCGRQFHHRSNLIRHTRLHTGVKPYVCCTCGQRFNQVSALKNHNLHRHAVGKTKNGFHCPMCGKIFSSLSVLKKHLKMVHKSSLVVTPSPADELKQSSNRKFYCNICGLSFSHVSELNEHEVEAHSKTDEFHCQSCNQKFQSVGAIKSHRCISQVRDDTKKEFMALQTDLLDDEELNLADEVENFHIITTAREEPPQRKIPSVPAAAVGIEKGGEDVREMVIHVQAEGQSELMAVHVKYNLNYLLSMDEQKVANEEKEKEPAEELLKATEEKEKVKTDAKQEEVKKYTCEDCGKKFKKKHNFSQHIAIHNIDMKKYTCPFCCQVYAWKTSLNKHVLVQHSEKADSFLCSLCPKSFNRSQAFHDHFRRDHLGLRPHKCTECDKTFFKKNDLTVHMRVHGKDKPYICGTCAKTFSHISHIIRHERIHSGVRPYSCDLCGKTFIQSSTLHVHRKRMHEGMSLKQQEGTVETETPSSMNLVSQALNETEVTEPTLNSLFDNDVFE